MSQDRVALYLQDAHDLREGMKLAQYAEQVFAKLELAETVDLSVAEYGGFMAQVIDRGV